MIQQYKIAHFIFGAVISAVVGFVVNPIAGFVASIVVGAAKEWIYDAWMGRGNFEAWDFYATMAGGGVITIGFALLTNKPI